MVKAYIKTSFGKQFIFDFLFQQEPEQPVDKVSFLNVNVM